MALFLEDFFTRVQGQALVDDVALDNLAGQRLLLAVGFEHDPRPPNVYRLVMTRDQYSHIMTA
jgi:hypothetical protein